MGFLLRTAVTGVALWLVTQLVSGIEFVGGENSVERAGIIFVVAVIFGLVNAIVRPVVRLISLPLFVITLGLFTFVVNALMLMLTAWIGDQFDLAFEVDGFWAALLGSLVISVVTFVINVLLPDKYES